MLKLHEYKLKFELDYNYHLNKRILRIIEMATNEPTNLPFNNFQQFDTVANQIQQTFQTLVDQLIVRRDALLHKLSQLREDYTNKETTRLEAIRELEKTRQQLEEMSLKVNKNIPIHRQATRVYQEGLDNLQTPTKLPYPLFQCQTLTSLQSAVSGFGDVLEWEVPDYSLKKEPILTAGKKGKGKNEFDALGLFFDENTQRIYIADCGNGRVQVMSLQGEFITSFGQDTLKNPSGISVNEDHIFVTDVGHDSVFKFCKNTRELLYSTKGSKELQLSGPNGLCTDTNGDVYVADCWNNRIVIFSTDLQFKSTFGTHKLNFPRDVKLTPDCVVVLDWSPKCVHLFSRDGGYLGSCIFQGYEQNSLVDHPRFFCLDLSGHIVISDRAHHCIKIFTQSGEFIHSIGREGNKKGEFILPCGIAISNSGVIFVVSHNPKYSLQCF